MINTLKTQQNKAKFRQLKLNLPNYQSSQSTFISKSFLFHSFLFKGLKIVKKEFIRSMVQKITKKGLSYIIPSIEYVSFATDFRTCIIRLLLLNPTLFYLQYNQYFGSRNYHMLPKGINDRKDMTKKINLTKEIFLQQCAEPSIRHRQINTAKVRSRQSQLSQHKTLPIKPINSPRIVFHESKSQLDHFSQLENHSLNKSRILSQFDNLQLEDFVKMVILQKGESALQSKEIIKSLNGTWFKSTKSPDKATHKFYSRLGIKRTRDKVKVVKSSENREINHSNETFKKQYTPPNIFPLRKVSPRKYLQAKLLIDAQKTDDSQIQVNSPLKDIILRKPNKKIRSQKRPSAYLTHKPLKDYKLQDDGGFLMGKKMQIRNQ